jgi:hypothetical protein
VVAILPFLAKNEGYEVVYRLVDYMAARHGFDVIDLGSSLAAEDLESLRMRPEDTIHANARGHRLFAERMAPVLARTLVEGGAWPRPGHDGSDGKATGR